MYRRIAFTAAALSLVTGGMLVVWALLRPYPNAQQYYGVALGIAGLVVGVVLLAGAMTIPASKGDVMARRSVSWVSLVVGLVVALFFLVPTSGSFDVRERTLDDGRVEKSLQPAYRSLGSGLVIGSFVPTIGWTPSMWPSVSRSRAPACCSSSC